MRHFEKNNNIEKRFSNYSQKYPKKSNQVKNDSQTKIIVHHLTSQPSSQLGLIQPTNLNSVQEMESLSVKPQTLIRKLNNNNYNNVISRFSNGSIQSTTRIQSNLNQRPSFTYTTLPQTKAAVLNEYSDHPPIKKHEVIISSTKYILQKETNQNNKKLFKSSTQTDFPVNPPYSNSFNVINVDPDCNPNFPKVTKKKYISKYLEVNKNTKQFQSNDQNFFKRPYKTSSFSHENLQNSLNLGSNTNNSGNSSNPKKYTYTIRNAKIGGSITNEEMKNKGKNGVG